MIGRIRGELTYKGPDGVEVLTAAGVGYEIAVPAVWLDRMPAVGQQVDLRTSLVVRDDALRLYGFETSRDRELFRRLQAASGVGPKLLDLRRPGPSRARLRPAREPGCGHAGRQLARRRRGADRGADPSRAPACLKRSGLRRRRRRCRRSPRPRRPSERSRWRDRSALAVSASSWARRR